MSVNNVSTILGVFWKGFVDFLFPSSCFSCKKPGTVMCLPCMHNLVSFPPTEHIWITALFAYKNPMIRNVIHHLKHYPDQTLVNNLAECIREHTLEEESIRNLFNPSEVILVIPIPLQKRSLRRRGYNQAELLAHAVADTNDSYILHKKNLVHNEKQKIKQALIKNRAKRKQNVRGTFSLQHPELIHDAHILIIDDVTTTHATLEEARKLLLTSGVRSVSAITIAH